MALQHIYTCLPPPCFFCSVPYALLQESKAIGFTVCVTPSTGMCPYQGRHSACEILPEHSCTILPLLYQLHFSGSSSACDLDPFLFLCSRLKQSPRNPPFYLQLLFTGLCPFHRCAEFCQSLLCWYLLFSLPAAHLGGEWDARAGERRQPGPWEVCWAVQLSTSQPHSPPSNLLQRVAYSELRSWELRACLRSINSMWSRTCSISVSEGCLYVFFVCFLYSAVCDKNHTQVTGLNYLHWSTSGWGRVSLSFGLFHDLKTVLHVEKE